MEIKPKVLVKAGIVLVNCLFLAGCQSDAPETSSSSGSDTTAAVAARPADSAPAPPSTKTRPEAGETDTTEEAKPPRVSASSPEEAVDVWYRAINTKDRALFEAVLLRRPRGFQFTRKDSITYEIEETEVFDTDEELAESAGVERGDVMILTKTRNTETGETYPGHFILLRETKEGWKITGFGTQQYIPEEVQ